MTTTEYTPQERIERLEHLLALLQGSSGTTITAGASTVVWRPGGVAGGNVFTTWAAVVAEVATMQGDITIGLDTDSGPANIPAGNYDLRPAGISGPVTIVNASKILTFGAPFLSLIGAVTIKGLSGLNDASIVNGSTVPVITAAFTNSFRMSGGASIFQTPGAAAFLAITGGAFSFWMNDFSTVVSLGGTNTITVAAPGTLALALNDESLFDTNMLAAVAGVTITVGFDASFFAQAGAAAIPLFKNSQRGSNAIVVGTGLTASITLDGLGRPVFVGASTRILCTQRVAANDGGPNPTVRYAALIRANGNPGSFQISALTNVGGGDGNLADTSTVDWELINN